MSPMDYLMNAGFVALVVAQARDRRLDRRAIVIPLVLVFLAAQQYLHSIPVWGNDLVLIGVLATAGVSLCPVSTVSKPPNVSVARCRAHTCWSSPRTPTTTRSSPRCERVLAAT